MSTPRLRLNRETLRRLNDRELRGVVGGTGNGLPDPKDPSKNVEQTDTCPTNNTQQCPEPDSYYVVCYM